MLHTLRRGLGSYDMAYVTVCVCDSQESKHHTPTYIQHLLGHGVHVPIVVGRCMSAEGSAYVPGYSGQNKHNTECARAHV